MAQDRIDVGLAVQELCRHMSNPRHCDWDKLKRFGRYLIDKTRVVVAFRYQEAPQCVSVWTDTDHAGCLSTRKSTSGGVIMLGSHCIKSWSVNQQVIAMSSGEAEYYGMVKGASNGLGIVAMLADLGVNLTINLNTHSSAAKGIASRRGLGKVRHIELCELWLQDQVARGKIVVNKIRGEDNFSDSLTKHSVDRISQSMQLTSQRYAIGRHPIMPGVAA